MKPQYWPQQPELYTMEHWKLYLTQLLHLRTLSYHDNSMGHLRGEGCQSCAVGRWITCVLLMSLLTCTMWDAFYSGKRHMGCLDWNWVQRSEVFCHTMKTCNGSWDGKTEAEHSKVLFLVILWKHVHNRTWDWKTETDQSKVKFFVTLCKHVMDLRIEQLKLGTAKWSFLSYCGNM